MTDIQGFVARDDHRKEIVVALRGRLVSLQLLLKKFGDHLMRLTELLKSASVVNILTDSQVLLVPFVAPGVKLPRKYTFSVIDLSIISAEIETRPQPEYAYIVVSFFRERLR